MTAQGNSELEIDSVVHSDAGEYTCRVQFQSPQDVRTGSATLQVASEGWALTEVKISINLYIFFSFRLYTVSGIYTIMHD